MIPGLTIHKQRNGNQYLISSNAVHPEFHFNISSGPLVPLFEEQMRSAGLDFVLRDMEGVSDRVPTPSAFQLMTKTQRVAFHRDHYNVGVSLQSGGNEIWISPMKPDGKGGTVGHADDDIILPLPSTNEMFFEALSLAVSRCQQ